MKFLKYIVIITAIIIISIIGIGIYFVGQISSTYPLIQTYNLDYSKLQFEDKLNRLDLKDEYKITFTDTTGIDIDSGHNYYFNISDKQTNDKYFLSFKAEKSFFKDDRIKLSLNGFIDEKTNKIIYSTDMDSDKVKEMFENGILVEIGK